MQNIDGDPPTRIFALVFLAVLIIATAGVIAAIAAGNISHYRYFPTPQISAANATALNLSRSLTIQSDRLWLSNEERRFPTKSQRKTVQKWFITMDEERKGR